MPATSRRLISALAAAAVSFPAAAHAAAAPDVVVSIAPVHSLVASVMAGVGAPNLLVPPGASPHAYALRPSDARTLAEADIVFRVGADLETFLDKPLAALVDGTVITLARWPGITLQRTAARVTEHGDDAGDDHERAFDPHIWLSPANGRRIAEIAARVLAEHDPEHADSYRRNFARLAAELADLERELAGRLAPVRDVPYVVLHDAYSHFEAAFGLRRTAAITVSPERKPGARRLRDIRQLLERGKVRCVFTEPQFPRDVAETLVAGIDARIAQLDPLGVDLAIGPGLYAALLRELGRSLAACLGA